MLKCSRSPSPIQHDYRLNDYVLVIKDEHHIWASHYINYYLGSDTYQKFLQKPHRHSISKDETLANVHLLSKPQLILP